MIKSFNLVQLHSDFQSHKLPNFIFGAKKKRILFSCDIILLMSLISFNTKNIKFLDRVQFHSRF